MSYGCKSTEILFRRYRTNILFLYFIKAETKSPNNYYDAFRPACVLLKSDILPLAFSMQLTNNIGKLSRKEIKWYVALVNNAYFAKAFMIHSSPS